MLPGAFGAEPNQPRAPTARYTIVAAAALVASSLVVRSKGVITNEHAAKIASFMFNDVLITPSCDTWPKVLHTVLDVLLKDTHTHTQTYANYKKLAAPPAEAELAGTIVFRDDAQSSWAAGSQQSSLQVVGERGVICYKKGDNLNLEYIGTKYDPDEWDNLVHAHDDPARGLYGMAVEEKGGKEMILDAWEHRFAKPNAGQIDAPTAYDSANVKLCPTTLKVIATQHIRGGDKLLLQYGDNYWANINHTVFIRKQVVYYKGKQCTVMKTDPQHMDQYIKLAEIKTTEHGQKTIVHKAPVADVTFTKPGKKRPNDGTQEEHSSKRANTSGYTSTDESDSEDDMPLAVASKYAKKVAENKALAAEIKGLKQALAAKDKEMDKLTAVLRAQDE